MLNILSSSTASIFGNPISTPIDEDHPKAPLHAYGKSKYMVEMILEDYDRAYGLKSACLRYFNASGADTSGSIGEAHAPETHLIPLVIQSMLKLRSHIDIYGDDYTTRDGTAIRDYIHVSDLALAHIKSLDWMLDHKQSIQLNLGTGSGYSIKEIIDTVERLSGKAVPWKLGPKSPDAAELVASSKKAFELTGWTPQSSSIDEIVSSAIAWHSKKKP